MKDNLLPQKEKKFFKQNHTEDGATLNSFKTIKKVVCKTLKNTSNSHETDKSSGEMNKIMPLGMIQVCMAHLTAPIYVAANGDLEERFHIWRLKQLIKLSVQGILPHICCIIMTEVKKGIGMLSEPCNKYRDSPMV